MAAASSSSGCSDSASASEAGPTAGAAGLGVSFFGSCLAATALLACQSPQLAAPPRIAALMLLPVLVALPQLVCAGAAQLRAEIARHAAICVEEVCGNSSMKVTPCATSSHALQLELTVPVPVPVVVQLTAPSPLMQVAEFEAEQHVKVKTRSVRCASHAVLFSLLLLVWISLAALSLLLDIGGMKLSLLKIGTDGMSALMQTKFGSLFVVDVYEAWWAERLYCAAQSKQLAAQRAAGAQG